MPKVKATCNLGAGLPPLKEGQIADISDSELAACKALKRCPVEVIEEPPVEKSPAVKTEPKPEPVAEKAAEPIKAEPAKPAVTSKQPKQ